MTSHTVLFVDGPLEGQWRVVEGSHYQVSMLPELEPVPWRQAEEPLEAEIEIKTLMYEVHGNYASLVKEV